MTWEDLEPHLKELARRLTKVVVVWISTSILGFIYWKPIYHWMAAPLLKVLEESGYKVDSSMIFTGVTEPFTVSMKLGLFVGLIISFPYLIYQLWGFIVPALYEEEKALAKRLAGPFIFWTTFLFLLGAAYGYYVIFPGAFKFLINWGGDDFVAMPRIGEYLGFFMKFMIGFGLGFNLPVFVYFFAKLDLINGDTLREYFRYAVVFIFIFAAIFTPPDVFSQFALAIPLLILYGISIWIGDWVAPSGRRNRENHPRD